MKVLTWLTLTVSLLGFVGCTKDDASTSPPPAETADDHGHDHAEGETHDHSVAGHAHGLGPHDGVVADWGGGKYHVEFTVDHDKTEATVYVYGGDETTPAPIDAESIELSIVDPEMVVTLNAAPQDDDPEGKASRFIGTHEKLGVVQEYEGTMTGVIDGTPYSGDFKEEAHDH
ncbi:hypothetical protein [Novipirellula maiorica]|uniref:hypothetical protein n=1 Tax=Novipirellula maiorica TaxID=1265734 RepID=UPI00034CE037|nr:hypothetical protein [Rhodopirellula maiorica]